MPAAPEVICRFFHHRIGTVRNDSGIQSAESTPVRRTRSGPGTVILNGDRLGKGETEGCAQLHIRFLLNIRPHGHPQLNVRHHVSPVYIVQLHIADVKELQGFRKHRHIQKCTDLSVSERLIESCKHHIIIDAVLSAVNLLLILTVELSVFIPQFQVIKILERKNLMLENDTQHYLKKIINEKVFYNIRHT